MMLVLRLDNLLDVLSAHPEPGLRKFEPGDRVRIVDGTWHTGTIVRHCRYPASRPRRGGYLIRLEDGHHNRPDGLYHAPTWAIVSA